MVEFSRRELLQRLAAVSLLLPLFNGRARGALREPRAAEAWRTKEFRLGAVRLLPGPFQSAQQRDARYLLSLDPDRLLHNFRVNAKLAPKAAVYGGWESQEPWVEIRCHGHTLGHYLSACSMMFAATGEVGFRRRVEYIVAELAACQQAQGSGLVCAFPDDAEPLLASLAGRPFSGVPWYTQHKIFAGLRDAYWHADVEAARPVLLRLADWTWQATQDVPDQRLQAMLDVEHGGMNEVLADVAVISADRRYLELARRFSHRALLEPLASGRDGLDGLHSNTQIPKVIGFERLYELAGDAAGGRAASFFWETVTTRRSFATGGNGDGEHFFAVDQFPQHLGSAKTMETCCTHNMLKLTRALFRRAPDARLADYYERALFNGILASQDPDSGMMTYFQATRPGYPKLYCTPVESFWCCTGSGMENHAKYGDSIYFQDDTTLYVNLFIASELDWREREVRITQQTVFPDEAGTRLRIQTRRPTRLTMKIRQPAWCAGVKLSVNGRSVSVRADADGYLSLRRLWRNGDRIEVDLPMRLHLQSLPGSEDIAALMYGPIVLAARLGTEGISPGADQLVNERQYGEVLNLPMPLPELPFSAQTLDLHIKRGSPAVLAFTVRAGSPDRDVELIPFYRIAHERYSLYWKVAAL